MHPFVLRRKKSEVLSQLIPLKSYVVETLPFNDATRSTYDNLIRDHVERKARKADGYEYETFEEEYGDSNKNIFTLLRKVSERTYEDAQARLLPKSTPLVTFVVELTVSLAFIRFARLLLLRHLALGAGGEPPASA